MPSIHDNLVFDHLYFGTNEEEFEEIKKIFLRFECASHQLVKVDDDSWEGVYVRTRGQNYLEFLKDRRVNGMGLCQKAFGLLSQDARNIVHDFPDLPWKTFERSMGGQKWFTALSCDNYLDLSTLFNTWVMHYHQNDGGKIVPLRKVEISRICEVHFSAHQSLMDKVKLNSSWFNSRNHFTEEAALFEIQTYYSDLFLLRISFDNTAPGFKFKKAVMKMEDEFHVPDLDLKFFKFYKDEGVHILYKK